MKRAPPVVLNPGNRVVLNSGNQLVLNVGNRVGLNRGNPAPESLWYEDGELLITQSYDLGLKSLWLPWAGYEHLYNRTIGLLARQAPLEWTPYFFFLAWLYAFFAIFWQIRSRVNLVRLNSISIGDHTSRSSVTSPLKTLSSQ
jgi:hypothetical protein